MGFLTGFILLGGRVNLAFQEVVSTLHQYIAFLNLHFRKVVSLMNDRGNSPNNSTLQ